MSLFFFKFLLGIGILVSAVIAVFTMLEIFGRSERKYDIETLIFLMKMWKISLHF